MTQKTALAFGDSLTWGFEAGTYRRHAFADRWPNVLAAGLGGDVRVIEEGLNGRTTVYDDPTVFENRNGAAMLPALLSTHQPLDLVIIMLGANDVKFAGRCRAFDAAQGAARLIEIVQRFSYLADYATPQILLVSPPHLVPTKDEKFIALFDHAIGESHLFAHHYRRVAEDMKVHFFDAALVAKADPTDGVHLDVANTRALGEALVPAVRGVLG